MSSEVTNPALVELAFLVGEWDMTLSNASFLPGPDEVVQGKMAVTPLEGGMLLALRQLGEPADPPLASWVIGRDGSRGDYTVLYTDGRGVSRVYEMSLSGDTWALWRNDPDFSQRFEASISADRRSVAGRWEKRTADGPWEHDFNVLYSRP